MITTRVRVHSELVVRATQRRKWEPFGTQMLIYLGMKHSGNQFAMHRSGSVGGPLALFAAKSAGGSRILEGCHHFALQSELVATGGLEPPTPAL